MTGLPNFFVVGAMKAGTTTLYDALRRHPDIFMPEDKEPFYFVWGAPYGARNFLIPVGTVLTSATSWMRVRTERDYRLLFSPGAGCRAIGEASTFYLPDPDAAARIRQAVPAARIIAVLRDPAERAYSAYMFQRSLGLEPAETFRAALEAELAGARDGWLYGWRHIQCGRYAEQVKRYLDAFGETGVLVLRFDDLRADPSRVVTRVFSFLGVDPDVALTPAVPANQTRLAPNRLVRAAKFLLVRPNVIKDSVKQALPHELRRRLKRAGLSLVDRFGMAPPGLAETDRAFLHDVYAAEYTALERLLGWDLRAWTGREVGE